MNKGLGYAPNPLFMLAGTTRLELATSGVTGVWKIKELR
jgi:hypothetical protein